MESVIVVATGLFIATNIDTLLVLIAFCLDEDYAIFEVLIGHYAGFLVGIVAALGATFIATGLLQRGTFLLGIVPISMGLWGFFRREPDPAEDDLQVIPGPTGRVSVVTATAIGLNGENLAVYIPFFVGLSIDQLLFVVIFYVVAAGALFVGALTLARLTGGLWHPPWIDRWLVPTVLIVVGSYVLVSGWLVL